MSRTKIENGADTVSYWENELRDTYMKIAQATSAMEKELEEVSSSWNDSNYKKVASILETSFAHIRRLEENIERMREKAGKLENIISDYQSQ